MPLASQDIPQANDAERVVRLAIHLRPGDDRPLPPEFAHPRDRHFYLGALRALGALDADDRPTARLLSLATHAEPRAAFAATFASCPVGAAWLGWAGKTALTDLDPDSAGSFLVACSALAPSTARRRASTLRRWLDWCVEANPQPPAEAPAEAPVEPGAVEPRGVPEAVSDTPRTDPNRLLAGLARAGAKLHLDTVDLCFVAALYLRADRGALASFDDEMLVDQFEQVCELVDPGAENPRKRATSAPMRRTSRPSAWSCRPERWCSTAR